MATEIQPYADSRKQLLSERCRDFDFVDDVEHLKCTRCQRMAIVHYFTNCGHALCPNCKRLLTGDGFHCPKCNELIQQIKEQSADYEEMVNNLQVKCSNSRYGCPLLTTVKLLPEHLVACEWTREKTLPAIYQGANTNQLLLEEVSRMKQQMIEMNGKIVSLEEEMNKKQEAENENKKNIEMTFEDLKSRINGLSSDLHYETTILKTEISSGKGKNVISDGVEKELDEKIARLNVKCEILTQMLTDNSRHSQKFAVEAEEISKKVLTFEDKLKAIKKEYKNTFKDMENECKKNIEKLEEDFLKYKQEIAVISKEMQEKVDKSFVNEELKKQQEEESNHRQKTDNSIVELNTQLIGIKSELSSATLKFKSEIDEQQKLLEKVRKEQLQTTMDMLDQKEDRFTKKLTKEVQILENKMLKNENELEQIKKDVDLSMEALKGQLKGLTSDFETTTELSCDIGMKINSLKEEVEQLSKKCKTTKLKVEGISKCILSGSVDKVQTMQQLNPHLNPFEAFQREILIGEMLNRKSNVAELLDSFLFGSIEEQMAFESLCSKWIIKDFNQFTQKNKGHEILSDILPVYGYDIKIQLKLKIAPYGNVDLYLCLKDQNKKVDLKFLPMVTYIFKDLGKTKRHKLRCANQKFKHSLTYDKFDYEKFIGDASDLKKLISSRDASAEILVLMEPFCFVNKLMSTDGSITDTIQHYEKRLQMMKEGLIDNHWSPHFLTQKDGYKVGVQMCLNGYIDNNRRGIIAEIHFLCGEFDSKLPTEFEHETRITLINHKDTSRNLTVTREGKKTDLYWLAIASEKEMLAGGFITNDSITYQVTIKPK